MFKLKKIIVYLCTLIFSFSLVGCKAETKEDVRENFHSLLDDIFVEEVTKDSISLHYTLAHPENYGIKDFNPTFGNYSYAQIKKEFIDTENTLSKLIACSYESLEQEDQLTYDILKHILSKNLQLGDYVYFSEQLGPSTGLQAQLPILLAEYAFYSEKDITTYIKILECVDDYFHLICNFEREKSAEGYFMTDEIVDRIIMQCEDFIASPKKNYLIESFAERLNTFPDMKKSQKFIYEEANRKAITNSVIPAYQELIDTLTSLRGSAKNSNGLCGIDGGSHYYELSAQLSTGSSKTIPEMRRALKTTLNQCFAAITTLSIKDPTLYDQYQTMSFPSVEPAAIMTYLEAVIKTDFPALAPVHCTVKYVPDSLKEHVSPAMYLIPPIDDYSDNSIYINDTPAYDMTKIFPTLAHEGYPGHMYQNIYLRKLNLHPLRSIINITGYDEGWATYVETYSYKLANLGDALSQFLQANMIAIHCLYSLTDIGIHYDGWTKQDTIDFWMDYVVSTQDAEEIYYTILGEPRLYLPYSIGYIEIMELQHQAKVSLESDFNLKNFHQFFLDFGPAPYEIIKKHFTTWLITQQ